MNVYLETPCPQYTHFQCHCSGSEFECSIFLCRKHQSSSGVRDLFRYLFYFLGGGGGHTDMFAQIRIHARIRASPENLAARGLVDLFLHAKNFSVLYSSIGIGVQSLPPVLYAYVFRIGIWKWSLASNGITRNFGNTCTCVQIILFFYSPFLQEKKKEPVLYIDLWQCTMSQVNCLCKTKIALKCYWMHVHMSKYNKTKWKFRTLVIVFCMCWAHGKNYDALLWQNEAIEKSYCYISCKWA